jgi:hypothetical protein
MLVGDLETLRGQARNAGNPNTRCMVGAEVLLLVSAGYRWSYPKEKYHVLELKHSGKSPYDDHQSIIDDAVKYLSNKGDSHNFWIEKRKQEYMKILN